MPFSSYERFRKLAAALTAVPVEEMHEVGATTARTEKRQRMVQTISSVRLNKRHESWMANAVDTLEWFRACGLWDAQAVPEQDPLQAVIDALNRTIGALDTDEPKRDQAP